MATNNRFITSYNGLTGVYYASSTGLVDIRSGQAYVGGGLYLGATTELTADEARSLTPPGSTPIYGGRYRFVGIDAGATAANLKFGNVVGWAPGSAVDSVSILTAGSGQTNGSYTATASSGGAVINYSIVGGLLTAVQLVNLGSGYTGGTVPTFTIAAGGTPGTVVAVMTVGVNYVTSFDQAVADSTPPVRGVILGGPPTAADLANPAYCWILENGKGWVNGNATIGSGAAAGTLVNAASGGAGTVNAGSANTFTASTVGYAIDTPQASAPFRVQLTLPNFGG